MELQAYGPSPAAGAMEPRPDFTRRVMDRDAGEGEDGRFENAFYPPGDKGNPRFLTTGPAAMSALAHVLRGT